MRTPRTSARAGLWGIALAALAPFASGRADSSSNWSMSVAVDPAVPAPGQLVTVTATFSTTSSDGWIPMDADFVMDPKTSFTRPLPSACWIAPACEIFSCDEDAIECFRSMPSPGSIAFTLSFTFPTDADRVFIDASGCRVSDLNSPCLEGVGQTVWIPDPPPEPPPSPTGCASAGGSSGGIVAAGLVVCIIALRLQRSRGRWSRDRAR